MGTTSSNFLPVVTGQDLGATGQRWDLFAQNGDFSGTVSITGNLAVVGNLGDVFVKSINGVKLADQFTGTDIGAKINAADATLGSTPGEIWVALTPSSTWTTSVNLSSNRILRFLVGGTITGASGLTTYLIGAVGTSGSHKSNIHIVGPGIGQLTLKAPASGGQLGAVCQFQYADDCSVSGMTMDGNSNTTTILIDEMGTRFRASNLRLLGDTTYNVNRNYCIHVRGSQYGTYENIIANGGSQDAILLGLGPFGATTQAAQYNRFTNIYAANSPWNGIDLGGSASLVVQYNKFQNIDVISNGSYSSGADDRFGLNLNFASFNEFSNLTAKDNQWSGIRINAGAGNKFLFDSQNNGLAGANTGDAVRLEAGTVGNPNTDNQFIGYARKNGTNFAILTSGTNSQRNLFIVNYGGDSLSLADNTNTLIPITSSSVPQFDQYGGITFFGAEPSDLAAPSISNRSGVGVNIRSAAQVNAIIGSGSTFGIQVTPGTNVLQIGSAGTISSYNSIATVGTGVASEIATVDLTAQTAAVSTATLYAVPASGAGQYRLSWNAKVTTAAGTSSTLGGLTITYTDPDGVVQTIAAAAQSSAGAIETSDAGNTTTTKLVGLPVLINAKASTNIQYAMAYASNAANAMNYNLHIKLESLG